MSASAIADYLGDLERRLAALEAERSEQRSPVVSLLTPREAAERAGVCVETIRRASREGRLRARQAGSAWRIAQGDLDAWLMSPRRDGGPSRLARVRIVRTPMADALRASNC